MAHRTKPIPALPPGVTMPGHPSNEPTSAPDTASQQPLGPLTPADQDTRFTFHLSGPQAGAFHPPAGFIAWNPHEENWTGFRTDADAYLEAIFAQADQDHPAIHSGAQLYVATNLAAYQVVFPVLDTSDPYAASPALTDQVLDGITHRRLTPMYYSWLRLRMTSARDAFSAGKLPQPAYDALRAKFNMIHDWAAWAFGKEVLTEVFTAFQASRGFGYAPPPSATGTSGKSKKPDNEESSCPF